MDSTRDSRASISSCKLLWKRQNKQKSNWARLVSSTEPTEVPLFQLIPRSGCRICCWSAFGVTQIPNPASTLSCGSSKDAQIMPGQCPAHRQHCPAAPDKPLPPPASAGSPPGNDWWRHPQSGRGSAGHQHHPAAWCHHRHPPGSAAVSVCQDTQREKDFCKNSKSFVKHFSGHTAG